MRKHTVVTSPLLAALLLISCTKNNDEGIPSYIQIDQIDLTTNTSTEGTSDHKIVDAWVFLNDNNIGGYELPATIPVLAEGKNEILVWPGIKNNGGVNTRLRFPYFTKYEVEPTLVRGEVLTLTPSVTYTEAADFWLEDFEDAGVKFEMSSNSQGTMSTTSDAAIVFEGNNSLKLHLDSDENIIQIQMIDLISLPRSGVKVFVEMNYKCNNTFALGLISNNIIRIEETPAFIANPTDVVNGEHSWNKIYVELTEFVSSQTNAISYGIFFVVSKDDDVDVADIYLDNIKIVY